MSDSKWQKFPFQSFGLPFSVGHTAVVFTWSTVLELFFPPALVALQPVYRGGLSPVALAPLGSRSREGSAHVLSGSQGGAFSCWAQRNPLRLREGMHHQPASSERASLWLVCAFSGSPQEPQCCACELLVRKGKEKILYLLKKQLFLAQLEPSKADFSGELSC